SRHRTTGRGRERATAASPRGDTSVTSVAPWPGPGGAGSVPGGPALGRGDLDTAARSALVPVAVQRGDVVPVLLGSGLVVGEPGGPGHCGEPVASGQLAGVLRGVCRQPVDRVAAGDLRRGPLQVAAAGVVPLGGQAAGRERAPGSLVGRRGQRGGGVVVLA